MKVKFYLLKSSQGLEVRPFCPACASEIETLDSYDSIAECCSRCGALSEFPGHVYRNWYATADGYDWESGGLSTLCDKCAETLETKIRHLDSWEPISENHTCCEQCGRLLAVED